MFRENQLKQSHNKEKSIKKTFRISCLDEIKNVDSYMKNPVILLNHDPFMFPIGRTLSIFNNKSECRCELLSITYRRMIGEKRTKALEDLILRTEELFPQTDIDGNLIELSISNV